MMVIVIKCKNLGFYKDDMIKMCPIYSKSKKNPYRFFIVKRILIDMNAIEITSCCQNKYGNKK